MNALALAVALMEMGTAALAEAAKLIAMAREGREPTPEESTAAKQRSKELSMRIDAICSSAAEEGN